MKKLLVPLLCVVTIASVAYSILGYFRYSSSRPLITVNGQPITRKEYEDRVDYMYSKPVLQEMVWERLFLQEAAKEGCLPDNQDVDDAIATIKRTTPQVLDQARATDPDLSLFRKEMLAKLALQNLRTQGISVSEDEARQYYQAHLTQFLLPQQTNTTMVVAHDSIDAATAKRLLQNGFAPSVIARQPGLGVIGINMQITSQLPATVGQTVLQMKPGEVRVLPIDGAYLIIEAKSIAQSVTPSFESIEPQIMIAARLAKAPAATVVMQELLARSTVAADSTRYAAAIPGVSDAVGAAGQ